MSYVVAKPEALTAAAADVATIGSALEAANATAATATTTVAAAGLDETSLGLSCQPRWVAAVC